MYAPSFTPVLDEMNGVDVSLWKMDHQNPFGRVGGHIPINPLAVPPWWNLFSYRYERFSNSLETFQRAPPVQRLIRAEKLVDQVQKLIGVMLDSVYGDEDGSRNGQERKYRSTVTRSASTSSDISRYRIRNHPPHHQSIEYTQGFPPQYSNRPHQNSNHGSRSTQPYSSRLYSYSCPSSIGRLSYTETIHAISTCLDALYFLIQAAQDLTDLPLLQIRHERLDELRLNPNSIGLCDIQHEIGNTINSVIQKLVIYDHSHVRRLVQNRPVMLIQLEELGGWTSENWERPFWRVGEGVEGLRRIRDWKSVKAKGVMGAIRDWVVL